MWQRKGTDRAFELLHSALRMVQAGIAADPWQLAGQLVARLEGYADPSKERFYVEEVEMFMETVRAWDDYEWYRPMGQTYDAAGGACVQTLTGHSKRVESVAISSDGSHIVSGSDDNTVKLWSVTSGECVKTFEGHSDWAVSYTHLTLPTIYSV